MRIVGNLDVETTWARIDAAARRGRGESAPSPDDPRFALPEPVMRKISAAATLLRVFAALSDDCVLWTPRAVDPSRMALDTFWMPKVRLVSGAMPATADMWWGEPTEVAARVNHRLFAWEAKVRHRQPRLPGGTIVRSIDDLERAASDFLGRAGPEPWVAKAPLSAAGRLRVRGAGELAEKERFQAQRLLELQGVLLFEPWMKRVMDFGVGGHVFDSHTTIGGIHGLQVDQRGRFTGISDFVAGLDASQGLSIGVAAAQAGESLRAAGYFGPYTIDGYAFVAGEGSDLQCISEINARTTFGDVAARIIDMARDTMPEVAGAESVTLRFGRGTPPDGTISLLLPGADDDTSAWLETPARHGM